MFIKSLMLLLVLSVIHNSCAEPMRNKYSKYLKLDPVKRFQEYIRIDTSQSKNIKCALEFWIRLANEVGLPHTILAPGGRPVFVATLKGSDPSLPSIMLNSHMDVVKVDESEWKYPPFEAHMVENGDIFGRGTQDTKDVGILYMEAIRNLKKNKITLKRTLHFTVMPDEEAGSDDGIKGFLKTKEFQALNVGFALDEGLPSTDDSLFVTYVDRRPWQMQFVIHGEGGHGLSMPDGSAMEKAHAFINRVMAYRDLQKQIMKTKTGHDYSGYNSVNINMINGGFAGNVIPSTFTLMIDMRLAPDANKDEMQSVVESWIQAAGNDTEISYIRHELYSEETAVDDSNPYWVAMRNTFKNMNVTVEPVVCPATSDMLFLRNLGIPGLGFSAKSNTILRAHKKDEYLNVLTFLKGIPIYTELIKSLGNVQSVSD